LKLVVALGGNAIDRPESRGEYQEQVENVRSACRGIVEIVKAGHRVVVTHGNGPQVGNLAIQQELGSAEVPVQPLHVLGAMTQGQIGYLIQRELSNILTESSVRRRVVSVVTQTLVRPDDPAFKNPSKPIGPFYDRETALKLEKERGYTIRRVRTGSDKGYRRVVPSPDPLRIVEEEIVAALVETGAIVVASGGGGIPVVLDKGGRLVGVDAVIDKDLAAERLAEAVGAERLLILTNVERVMLNYGKRGEMALDSLTLKEAKRHLEEGQFPPGSMGPKVLACVRFVEWGGKEAAIGPLERAGDVLSGKAGTRILTE
jgi:carbamate kinase